MALKAASCCVERQLEFETSNAIGAAVTITNHILPRHRVRLVIASA